MTKAMIVLNSSRKVDEPLKVTAGGVHQTTRLYEGDMCVCVLQVTYTPDSDEHRRAMTAFKAAFPNWHPDDLRNVRDWTVESDVVPA